MSWIKKIIGRKEASDSASAPANDETVLFGDGSTPSTPPIPSRSSMISELAGLDPEASADLSSDLESTPGELLSEPSEESISLDFDDPSDQQETAIFSDDAEQQQDLSSDQQQTAVFDQPVVEDSALMPVAAQIPVPSSSSSAMPELEFDSDPGLDTDFDNPLAPQPANAGPASAVEENSAAVDELVNDNETLPPSQPLSMIDQMAGEFDLDLGEAEEPTAEAFPAAEKGSGVDEMTDLPTNEQPQTAPTPEQDLVATANGENYFDQLATAKLDQPLPVSPTPPASAAHAADDFDVTVITTAANEPSQAAGADYVTGWLVVIDGPGKGQSRPIRAGINSVGRAPDQAIPLYFGAKSDGEISRRDHARIVYDARGNHFKLVHGASRNLTYLNDEAVLEITDLKAYDRIVIGKTTLLFLPLCGNIFRW